MPDVLFQSEFTYGHNIFVLLLNPYFNTILRIKLSVLDFSILLFIYLFPGYFTTLSVPQTVQR
jgi:hypothetical protein